MNERIELVVLPAIAGHAHALGADGQPTCGCVSRVSAFQLRTIADEWERLSRAGKPVETFIAKTHKSFCRVEYPPHHCTCKPVEFSKCDVGSDVPGGGAV